MLPTFENVVTAEDARPSLSDVGEPVIVYFASHPRYCRGLSMTDLRPYVDGLAEAYRDVGAPLRFGEQIRLERPGQHEIEARRRSLFCADAAQKNWALFSTPSEYLRHSRQWRS